MGRDIIPGTASWGMRKTRIEDAERAVADIHRACRLLDSARRRLANATCCGAPSVIVQPSMRGIHKLLCFKKCCYC